MNKQFVGKNTSLYIPIISLLSIWIIYLALLGLLQLLQLKFGFNVWPMGEDRNFLGFMTVAEGARVAHEFWQMNDRNPLAVWWWIAGMPLIKHTDAGLYLLRKCLDPFLAIATFLLLDRLGRQQCRTFAFSVALLTLLWNFSSYLEQINWPFLGALSINVLAIYFYCRYIDSNRKNNRDLALALLLYLFTLSTYTLQSGAIIAVACLAFFRHPVADQPYGIKQRITNTLWEGGFFAAIFALYNCIWYTASRNADVFYVFNWDIFTKQLFQSIHNFVFHKSYIALVKTTLTDFSLPIIGLIFFAALAFFNYLFFKSPVDKIVDHNQNVPLGWVIVVALALITPTIIVESTSTIWYPGSRSLMVQQVWQPLFYVTIIFLIMRIAPIPSIRIKHNLTMIAVSLLCSAALLIGLDYNHRLVLRTHYQRTLAKGIANLHVPVSENTTFLVKITRPELPEINTIPMVIAIYGRTMLHYPVSFRVLPINPCPEREPYWRTVFKDNIAINAGSYGKEPVTYKDLWIVFYDGKNVWVPEKLDKADFADVQVSWERTLPIDQRGKIK